ncbi:MAG TPA: hypothetical protein V6D17_00090, partial [Candidatus Obscuribacterales bacterium]
MFDFLVVLGCGILGLMAHGAQTRPWLEWILRAAIGLSFLVEALIAFGGASAGDWRRNPWATSVLMGMCVLTGLLLFRVCRQGFSFLFTGIDAVVSFGFLVALKRKLSPAAALLTVFIPTSIPH